MEVLATILYYALFAAPPALAGAFSYKKLKIKYARPLEKGVDWRVYILTAVYALAAFFAVWFIWITIIFFVYVY